MKYMELEESGDFLRKMVICLDKMTNLRWKYDNFLLWSHIFCKNNMHQELEQN